VTRGWRTRAGARASRWLAPGLALACLVACSSQPKKLASLDQAGKEWSAAVDRAVHDPARAARLKALGQRLAEVQRSMADDLAALDAQGVALNSSYGSTAEDAHRVSRAYEAQRRRSFATYRDLVLAMRAEASQAEWKELTR
jgi:hypothetical protein